MLGICEMKRTACGRMITVTGEMVLYSGKENVPFALAQCLYRTMLRPNKPSSAGGERGVLRTAKGGDGQLTRYPSET